MLCCGPGPDTHHPVVEPVCCTTNADMSDKLRWWELHQLTNLNDL